MLLVAHTIEQCWYAYVISTQAVLHVVWTMVPVAASLLIMILIILE